MPTDLIYRAWKETSKPMLYDTSDGVKKVQKEVHLKNPVDHDKFVAHLKDCCMICGKDFEGGFATKSLLGDTYNDWDISKNPESRSICQACAFTLILNMDHSRCKLNTYSFLADKSLHILNRQQIRDHLLNPPEDPFVFVITLSQKKHLAIKASIAYDRDYFPVQLEEETVYCDRKTVGSHIRFAEALRGVGFTKDEILSGRFNGAKSTKFNASALLLIEDEILERKKERSYALAVFAAQIQNEEEAECYLVSQLKMNTPLQLHRSSMQYTAVETKEEVRQASTCGQKSSDSPELQQNVQMELEIF